MTPKPIDLILPRLQRVWKRPGRSWVARCPAHDDKGPSLSIRETDSEAVLLHCFAGCPPGAVIAALGIQFSDLFPQKPTLEGKPTDRPPDPWQDLFNWRKRRFQELMLDLEPIALAASLVAAFIEDPDGVELTPSDARRVEDSARHILELLRKLA